MDDEPISPLTLQDSDVLKEYERLFDDFFFEREEETKKESYKISAHLWGYIFEICYYFL